MSGPICGTYYPADIALLGTVIGCMAAALVVSVLTGLALFGLERRLNP